jgi:hypothetical protein
LTVTEQSTAGGTPLLEDAWVRYRLADQWAVYGGQYVTPISHSNLVSSARALAVDESLADTLLIRSPLDYTQGVGAAYELKQFRVQANYNDGGNSERNTKYYDNTAEWGAGARAEWMISGDNWKQYDQFTSMGNKSDLAVLGAGVQYSELAGKDVTYHAADFQWNPIAVQGLSVYAGYLGQFVGYRNSAADTAGTNRSYNYGLVAQAGYMLTSKLEVFGRFDETFLDKNQFAGSPETEIPEITAGVNYYINGHSAKFTTDVVWLPNGLDSGLTGFTSADGLGILPTSGNAQEVVLRVQFQLLL